jgi:hypothetical protein
VISACSAGGPSLATAMAEWVVMGAMGQPWEAQ